MTTRRSFLKQVARTAPLALAARLGNPHLCRAAADEGGWPIAIFEKVLERLSYEELADAVVEMGADGVEATIRPRGHIEPAGAADEVPKMAAAMESRGKRVIIAATGVTSVDSPHAEVLLKTFQAVGISHYRTGYYYYDHSRPIKQQVVEFSAQAKELAAMNRSFGLQGLYQTHAGARYLGAMGWDLALMLDGIDPDSFGAAIDLRHIRADSGSSWKTAVQVLKPHVRSIYVKDAVWKGERSDQLENVPVDTGFVTNEIFDFVRRDLPPMPLCIHMEHMGYRVFEKHEIPGAIRAHQADIAALRRWMAD